MFSTRSRFKNIDRSGFNLTDMGTRDVSTDIGTPVMSQGINRPWMDRFKENAPRYASVIGATLQDVGGALNGTPANALQRLAAQDEQAKLKAQQDAVYAELAKGVDMSSPYGILAKAQQVGVPTDVFIDVMKSSQPKIVNTTTGAVIVQPDGSFTPVEGGLADLERKRVESIIKANEALSGQRGASEQYNLAKAKQPYAPRANKVAKAAAKAGGLPPGFILD